MEQLARMRSGVPRPGAQRLAAGRERLRAAIDEEGDQATTSAFSRQTPKGNPMYRTDDPTPERRPGLFARHPALTVVLATAATVAVVTTGVVALDQGAGDGDGKRNDRSLGDVSPEKVLNEAARQEREANRTVAPRNDQFIYTREYIKEIERESGREKVYKDENWISVDGSRRSWVMEIGHGWWAGPDKDKENEESWPPRDWPTLRKLPTDPEKLIFEVRLPTSRPGKNETLKDITRHEWSMVYFKLAGLLHRVPVLPEGLRSAAFEALSLVPGIALKKNVKDAKGRAGVAISNQAKGTFQRSQWLIFDRKTHRFLGFRDTRTSLKGKKTYTQLSSLDSYAVVDEAKQRPSSSSPSPTTTSDPAPPSPTSKR
ncbi:CU044_5270 family protein [Streptomyces sp. NPDC005438]|uniref:CU044_5270 family protein n=1 Tax=Streptomyces sp. NPDC005438 TaxID=3156880 RepID=UPI0033AD4798